MDTSQAQAQADQATASLVPQVIVTLSPEGGLLAELPGVNGFRRQVPLRSGEAGESLLRILHAQLVSGHTRIGLDEAPTEAQVWHWEHHGVFAEATCPWCQELARAQGRKRVARKRAQPPVVIAEHGDVTIRRFTAKGAQAKTLDASHMDAEELFG